MPKKIAIMQPYFFPYIGYFSLIKNTDMFILFDIVQFIRHGWIERNRVLKQGEGWQYISVPLLKHSRETLIKDIQINNSEKWKDKILAQLTHYKKKAPFYKETIDIIRNALDIETDSIVKLNYSVLNTICKYLQIQFNCQIFSESPALATSSRKIASASRTTASLSSVTSPRTRIARPGPGNG